MEWQTKQEKTSRYQPPEKVNFPRPVTVQHGREMEETEKNMEREVERKEEAKEGAQTE